MNHHTPISEDCSYEGDFHLWSLTQAAFIRAGKFEEIDIENVAEEIESLGRRDRVNIRRGLDDLLLRLLKWQFQPSKRRKRWQWAIRDARDKITMLIEESPSLKDFPAKVLAKEYDDARHRAALLKGLSEKRLPAECPYSVAEILDDDFLPGA